MSVFVSILGCHWPFPHPCAANSLRQDAVIPTAQLHQKPRSQLLFVVHPGPQRPRVAQRHNLAMSLAKHSQDNQLKRDLEELGHVCVGVELVIQETYSYIHINDDYIILYWQCL